MKNTPKSSPSRLLSTTQGGFKRSEPQTTLTPQNRKNISVEQSIPSNRGVSSTLQSGLKDSERPKNSWLQNSVNVKQSTPSNRDGASRDKSKERTDVRKSGIKEEENIKILETYTPDQFHKKCVLFLENSLKDYGNFFV